MSHESGREVEGKKEMDDMDFMDDMDRGKEYEIYDLRK